MRTETLACHRMCIDIKFWADFRVPQVLHNSCNMCMSILPDMYIRILRAACYNY